jgi:hypothetical protein
LNIIEGGKMKIVARLSAVLSLVVSLAGGVWAADSPTTALANLDCVKCHAKPPADIAAAGGAHKTSVSCVDCHIGHPPAVKHPIPKCSMCHSDKPHYKLAACLSCHKNPHKPKEISFGRNVTEPCLSCHSSQIKQLKENRSKHSALNCSFCHDVHGKIPQCTQCHKPHSSDMTAADCKSCHKAHMPTVVTYDKTLPNKNCAGCHKNAMSLLSASNSKHGKLLCVTCHQNKHKMVPKCQDCHGTPHPAGLLAKFPKCQECHNIAHDLNNWTKAATPAKAVKAKKAAVKKRAE